MDDDWGEVDTPQAYLNEAAHWLKQASQIAQRYMRLIESLDAFEDQGIGALEQWLSEDEGRSGREEPTRNDLRDATRVRRGSMIGKRFVKPSGRLLETAPMQAGTTTAARIGVA